jgi:hypothetical protein
MLKMDHFFQLYKIGPVFSKWTRRQVHFPILLVESYFQIKKKRKNEWMDEHTPALYTI